MSNNPDASINDLVEKFTKELRQGAAPDIERYATQYPGHADQIRNLFPVLEMMEAGPGATESKSGLELSGSFADFHELESRQSIGDYRIIRELGRGGMGVVYLAEQEALGRSVAIKVLPESAQFDQRRLQRFHQEAKAAGKLNHKGIVPVFQVGHDVDVSFLVMQYIDGVSLDHVLRKMRVESSPDDTLGMGGNKTDASSVKSEPLPDGEPSAEVEDQHRADSIAASVSAISGEGKYFRNIAEIGVQVSDALAYAHREDVLHRDIKPGNLMLDSKGNAWITDFGLAKILNDINLTKTGETVGTLRYVSPEQLRGFSDARSDIYSLGLTLYELLALQPAFRGVEFAEVVEEITNKTPKRLRKIDSNIPRDLETIVMTAISKDPRQRYQTAESLKDDLQRYLDGKTILAKQTSEVEKFVKAVKRRPVVSALAGLLLGSLILGAALTSWKWREAANSLAVSQQEAKTRQAINDFFVVDLLGKANPSYQPNPDVKLRTVLQRSAQEVGKRFRDDPVTEAEVRFQIGRVFYGLSDYHEARRQFEKSLRIRERKLGKVHPDTMQVLYRVGKAEKQLDNHEAAIEIFDRVIDFYRTSHSSETANLFDAMMMKAGSLTDLNRLAEAEEAAKEFLEYAYNDNDLDLKIGMERLAKVYYQQGKYLECEKMIRQRIKMSSNPKRAMTASNLLALSQMARGDAQSAGETFGKLLGVLEVEYGKEHDWTMLCAKNYAEALMKTDQYEKSIELLQEYLPLSKKVRGITHRHTLSIQKLLAEVLVQTGRDNAGLEVLGSVNESLAAAKGGMNRGSIEGLIELAWQHRRLGDFEKAASIFEKAYEAATSRFGDSDRTAMRALEGLGDVNRKLENYKLAEEYLKTVVARYRATVDAEDIDLLQSIESLMKLFLKTERFEQAETLANELVEKYGTSLGKDSKKYDDAMWYLREIHFETRNYVGAKEALSELHQIAAKRDPFSKDSMSYLFELDFVDGKLSRHQQRIDRMLEFSKLAEQESRKDGNYWKARGLLGQAYYGLGDLETAAQVLLKAHAGLEAIRDQVDESFYRKYMGRSAGRLKDVYEGLKNKDERDRWEQIYRSFRS